MAVTIAATALTFVAVFCYAYGLLEWAVNLAERRTYRASVGRR